MLEFLKRLAPGRSARRKAELDAVEREMADAHRAVTTQAERLTRALEDFKRQRDRTHGHQ